MATQKKAASKRQGPRLDEQQSTSEAMAAEAAPAKKPAGAPAVVPFAALPRRQKAQFLSHHQALVDQSDQLQATFGQDDDEGGERSVSPADAALLYNVLADVEDAMLAVAVDQDAMRKWLTSASDDDLFALMAWYADRFQVGEA